MEFGNTNRPMIIAMKGIPSKSKSRLALSVAKKLRCPFMDHDDLLPALQQCLPPSLLDLHDLINFSLEALCRIAQSQLRLKLNVIINSPLSDPTHFDRLVHLAVSNDSTLLLINCRSQQESSSLEDYDVGDVRKLIIDLTDEQVKEELVISVMQFIRSGSDLTLDLDLNLNLNLASDLKNNISEEEEREKTDSEDDDQILFKDFAHSDHPLVFCDDEDVNNSDGISCKACHEPIFGQIYSCVECKFYLHKSCAELPRKINSPVFSNPETLYLNMRSGSAFCWACGDQQGKCVYLSHRKTYSLELDPKCVKSPTVLEREYHQHKLYLVLTGNSFFSSPNCNACGNRGLPIQYSCSECDLNLHVRCALLPTTIKHECHCDPLTLTPPPASLLDEECYCDVCETERQPNHWFYYCSDCDLAAHLSCVIPEVRALMARIASLPLPGFLQMITGLSSLSLSVEDSIGDSPPIANQQSEQAE